MIVPFAIAAWILSVLFVTALCLVARRGDAQMHGDPVAEPLSDSVEVVLVVDELAVVAAAA
jgi:hypothetical protein